jgi:type II secretory pathway pseudopilin PulG
MKRKLYSSAFSLVEVTLALGIAAFSLIAVLAMLPVGTKTQRVSVQQTTANAIMAQITAFLRADVRLPPGQLTKACGNPPAQTCAWSNLSGHWADVRTPDTLFFSNDLQLLQAGPNTTVPPNAAFRALITYYRPPTQGYTTSLASIKVSWPAAVDPTTGGVPEGSVETFVAVNR